MLKPGLPDLNHDAVCQGPLGFQAASAEAGARAPGAVGAFDSDRNHVANTGVADGATGVSAHFEQKLGVAEQKPACALGGRAVLESERFPALRLSQNSNCRATPPPNRASN